MTVFACVAFLLLATAPASGETVAEKEIGTSTTVRALEIGSGGRRLKATVSGSSLDNADTFLFLLAGVLNCPSSP